MKRLAMVAVMVLCGGAAHAQDAISSAVFAHGVEPCDGVERWTVWTNQTGKAVRIKRLTVTTRAERGLRGDLRAVINRYDWKGLAAMNLVLLERGNYADGSAAHVYEQSFTPDHVPVEPGGIVAFVRRCTPQEDTLHGAGHDQTMIFWYGPL